MHADNTFNFDAAVFQCWEKWRDKTHILANNTQY